MKKKLHFILSLLLVALIAVSAFAGCTDRKDPDRSGENSAPADSTPVGVTFKFQMVDKDENLTEWDITTTETNLAEALLAEELIEGSDGAYGLFVTVVNGVALDEDNAYWELLVDGESSMVGVSSVTIDPAKVYAFKYSTF
jgi:hypothetical protein